MRLVDAKKLQKGDKVDIWSSNLKGVHVEKTIPDPDPRVKLLVEVLIPDHAEGTRRIAEGLPVTFFKAEKFDYKLVSHPLSKFGGD